MQKQYSIGTLKIDMTVEDYENIKQVSIYS